MRKPSNDVPHHVRARGLLFGTLLLFPGLLFSGGALANLECNIGTEKKWNGGFVVKDIRITNSGRQSVQNWRARLVFDNAISLENYWGAALELNGAVVDARGLSHNENLSAGESTSFGLKGAGSYGSVSCDVNGVGSPSPTPTAAPSPAPSPSPLPTLPPPAGGVVYSEDFEAYSPSERWNNVRDTEIFSSCGGSRRQCLRVRYAPSSTVRRSPQRNRGEADGAARRRRCTELR